MSQANLEKENKELKNKLLQNLAQLQTVTGIAVKLEKRLCEMEASVFWRARIASLRVWQYFKRAVFTAKDNSLWFERFRYFISKYVFKSGRKLLKIIFKNLYLMLEDQQVKIVPINQTFINGHEELFRIEEDLEFFRNKPLISIIMPVFDTRIEYLKEAIDSVRNQYYSHWELCIVDNCSTNNEVHELLKEYQKKDHRIKVVFRDMQGCAAVCSNSAIEIAEGEYIALLDSDDLISSEALYEVVRKINLHTEVDFIYSDEDKFKHNGIFVDAYHKPVWSPDSFLLWNYIAHFAVIRRDLVDQVKGFREEFEGSHDYDLFLRITDITKRIFHIPKILYHFRIHENVSASYSSSKIYAYEAAKKSLEDTVQRRQLNVKVGVNPNISGCFTLRYTPVNLHKVSIIIPTKDKADILKKCLESVFRYTHYSSFEVLVVSNNSKEQSLFDLLEEYSLKFPDCFKYYEHNILFNYSQLMNVAAEKASGEILLFLNNDTEIIHEGWLEEMLGQAERDSIGAVGCKLLYANDTVQHAGVSIGLGGARHLYVGEDRNALGYFGGLSCINNYLAVTAACMMTRRSVFEEVGGFDENLKVEFNDTDFCLKLIEKGYYNVYLPQVEVYHHESLSRGYTGAIVKADNLGLTDGEIFTSRWKQYIKYDPFFSIHWSKGDSDFRLLSNV